jgi:transcriptional regulator with XRE-family HTH domain
MLTFGKCLRDVMEARQLSCSAFAERVGTSQGYLSKILRGGRPPPKDAKLWSWMDRLDATPQERRRLVMAAALDQAPPPLVELLHHALMETKGGRHRVGEVDPSTSGEDLLEHCCQWAEDRRLALSSPPAPRLRRKIS